MKTVRLVRHGRAKANDQGLLAGAQTDSPLVQAGRDEAVDAAKKLYGTAVDLIVTSPLSRATETAQIIAEYIGYTGEIVVSPLFIERDFGSATNLPKAQAFALLDAGTATGVESSTELGERAQRAHDYLTAQAADNIVVVTHAAFIQMLGTVSNGGDPADFLSFPNPGNAEIVELQVA